MFAKLTLVISTLLFCTSNAMASAAQTPAGPGAHSVQKNQHPRSKKRSKQILNKHSQQCGDDGHGNDWCSNG